MTCGFLTQGTSTTPRESLTRLPHGADQSPVVVPYATLHTFADMRGAKALVFPAGRPARRRKHGSWAAHRTRRTSAPAKPAGATQRALERRRNVLLAQHHRQQGWSIAQIAHLLDRAPATVRGYLHDPTGEKAKAPQGLLRRHAASAAARRPPAPTARAARRATASAASRNRGRAGRARRVRGAHRFWRERFGFIASSVDWSGTHARRRGGAALERYRSARWPSQSVIRRLYGTPAAARADAFPTPRATRADPRGATTRARPTRHARRGRPRRTRADRQRARRVAPGREPSRCPPRPSPTVATAGLTWAPSSPPARGSPAPPPRWPAPACCCSPPPPA